MKRSRRAKHSNGVSLLQRAPGPHRYSDENAPGEKRYLRRRVRHMQKKQFLKDLGA